MEEKRKTIKRLTPPNEGFDSLLQRITTSLLFLMPNDFEKRKRISLHSKDRRKPPIKKLINSRIEFSTF